MICPNCNKQIDRVIVSSQCWQWGYLCPDTDEIERYGDLQEILDTGPVCPKCHFNIQAAFTFEE